MKHSLVRQTIIETAADLFYQQGYNLTGINEIIQEAGIAKATLYNHFKSKDDICVAYLNHLNTNFLNDLDKFVSKIPKGEAKVVSVFDFLETFYLSKEFNGCWCLNTISEIPRENEKVRSEIQKEKGEFLKFIEDLVSDNCDYPADESKNLARQIYLMYESAISESHLHQELWPIKTAKEMVKHILS